MGVNVVGASVRQVQRITAGELLKKKQNRAENLKIINEVMGLRPRDYRKLGSGDFKIIGQKYNIPPLALHVLADKESGINGAGFASDGRLLILAEPHIFSKHTNHAYDISDPHLSYPKWLKNKSGQNPPKGFKKHPYNYSQPERWALWMDMASLNAEAAICAISMGRFQVMGFHWKNMGFISAFHMVKFASQSERNQLELMIKWFELNRRMEDLRNMRWRGVAYYNGTGQLDEYSSDCEKIAKRRAKLYIA